MNQNEAIPFIQEKAAAMRRDCIEMGYSAGNHGAHFGPALSCIEVVASLFFGVMNHNPQVPSMANRDRFVLSKGHACLAYYAALVEAGYFAREVMYTFKHDNSYLSGHPICHPEYGLEVASGSLGNGFAVACGMAMAGKVKKESHNVYCILGDGECDEGLVWEAAMNAAKNELDNLIAVVDRNSFQLAGKTHEIMNLNLEAIWKAFGWDVQMVADGNDVQSVLTALNEMKNSKSGRPHVIIAKTLKGKGVSFMENNLAWHAAPLSKINYEQAVTELDAQQVGGQSNA
ncbi:MAG: transketolase [Eubacteriales bacterium]|nr:transketolase [Eubacteriales bacterium]